MKILYGSDIYHTQVYQRFEEEEKEWLMVRPSYPPFYYERYVRKIEADQAPLVAVYGSRKVGDLVDWRYKGCFWCATVMELERNALQVHRKPDWCCKVVCYPFFLVLCFLSGTVNLAD